METRVAGVAAIDDTGLGANPDGDTVPRAERAGGLPFLLGAGQGPRSPEDFHNQQGASFLTGR